MIFSLHWSITQFSLQLFLKSCTLFKFFFILRAYNLGSFWIMCKSIFKLFHACLVFFLVRNKLHALMVTIDNLYKFVWMLISFYKTINININLHYWLLVPYIYVHILYAIIGTQHCLKKCFGTISVVLGK